jgi:hypothetical protein
MKRQAIIIMDRFRNSSEQEKVALQQAKEALSLRDTAVAEAALWPLLEKIICLT